MRCSPAPDARTDCVDPQGYTWLVTFESVQYPGDQHTRFNSPYQTVAGHKLSVDGVNLLSCATKEGLGNDPLGTDCQRAAGNVSVVSTLTGSRQEVQTFVCDANGGRAAGTQNSDSFSLQVRGDYTQTLYLRKPNRLTFPETFSFKDRGEGTGLALNRGPVGESDRTRLVGEDGEEIYAQVSLEEAIECVAGDVTLTCDDCPLTSRFDGANVTWLPCSGQNVTVTFGSARGDIPPIYVSTNQWADELVKGVAQERVGRMTYQALLTDAISDGSSWHVRVSSYTSVGAGEARVATGLAPLQPSVTAPMAVRSATATHTGDHEVLVGWDEPLSSGGVPVDSFILEYDTAPSFASQCVSGYRPGTFLGYLNSLFKCKDVGPLGRLEIPASVADQTLGDVMYASPESADHAQRSRLILPVAAAAELAVDDFINVDGKHYQVKAINADAFFKATTGERVNCPSEATCLELTENYVGRYVNGSLPSLPVFGSKAIGAHYSFELSSLKSGVQYYFRIAARTKPAWSGDWRRSHVVAFEERGDDEYLVGPWSSNVATALCADVPDVVEGAALGTGVVEGSCADSEACAALAAHSVRVDFKPPALAYPEGNNGAAVTLYEVQLSGRQPAVQTIILTPKLGPEASLGAGFYRLQSGNATTQCIDVNAPAATVELRLEELPYVDGVTVVKTKDPKTGATSYEVTYDGAYTSNSYVDSLYVRPLGSCAAPYDPAQAVVTTSASSAKPKFQPGAVPEVATIKTGARVYRENGLAYRGPISGKFEVAWDFTGAPDLALWDPAPQKIVTASVNAGSTRVTVPVEYNLTVLLNPGDLVRIGDEVHRVSESLTANAYKGQGRYGPGESFDLVDYHLAGCAGCVVHVEQTRLGSGFTSNASSWSGRVRDLETSLVYQANNIRFPGSEAALYGSTGLIGRDGRNASAFRRQHVLVPHDASSREMKAALESLPGLGSVEVSRWGPNPTDGYTWSITFTSLDGASKCPDAPCLTASAQSANYVTLNECTVTTYNGVYVENGQLENGRSVFEKVGTPFSLRFNGTGWGLNYHGNKTLYKDRIGTWNRKVAAKYPTWNTARSQIAPSDSRSSFYFPTYGERFGQSGCVVAQVPGTARGGSAQDVPTLVSTVQDPSIANAYANYTYAEAKVERLGLSPSFAQPMYASTTSGGTAEVQAISLTASKDDIDGTFTLTFEDTESVVGTTFKAWKPVVIEFDVTAEDLATQLENLASVGRVKTTKTMLPNIDDGTTYGAVWTVTFSSQLGNVPNLIAAPSVTGTAVKLTVETIEEGVDPTYAALATGLESGHAYSARVRAVNSEGAGRWTNEPAGGAKGALKAQGQGAGVVPFSFTAASIPGPVPDLVLEPASDSRIRVAYGEADSHGLPVEAYLVEWTTADSFTKSSETWTLEVEAGPWGLADLQGRWSISVGSFTTHPMGPLAPAHVVQEAIGALPNVGATRVTRSATKNVATYTVKLMQDVGDIDGVAVNVQELQSIDHPLAFNVSGAVTNNTEIGVAYPANYGSLVVYTDADGNRDGSWRADGGPDIPRGRCGSHYAGLLDSWDAIQLLTLSVVDPQQGYADAWVDGGSYKLDLGGFETQCISYKASALDLKEALEELPFVSEGSVQVRATEAQNKTGFPFEYSILFRGSYVDGAWPQLRVAPEAFGTQYTDTGLGMGGCQEFSVKQTGDTPLLKSNVTATIVPIGSHETCAGGNGDVQVVVAEATTALGGTLDIYFGGQSIKGFPVDGHARDLEALLNELVAGVEVSKHAHADAPYGVAFAVTFPPSAGRVDLLAAGASTLTGGDATANVYPVVNVSTMADERDMAGTFRLSVGDQKTNDIRWDATQIGRAHV